MSLCLYPPSVSWLLISIACHNSLVTESALSLSKGH
jgi:hypothetical protein